MAARDLTAARLRELLNYDPETGLLTWRAARHGVFAGAVAGWTSRQGYIHLSVEGCTQQAHRLAWLHVYGAWPAQHIDHINGVRDDNRIANLRDVLPRVNAENVRRVHAQNKSGFMGVRKARTPGKWQASIIVKGRFLYLGVFTSTEEAHEAYVAAKRIHHEGCTI